MPSTKIPAGHARARQVRIGPVRSAERNAMEFDTETIAAAERVMGVRYTEAERAMMQGNLAPQIQSARKRRELDFPNDLAPATRFDPRLPGFRAPAAQRPLRWSEPDPGTLPRGDEDIAFAPVTHLAHWIRSGELTSRRLTEIYLARIEAIAPTLECFVTVTAEPARAEADAMDALSRAGASLGPLHGMPYALKDLFDAAGVRTTWGAEPWADRIADGDSAVVERLRAAGAVLLGKATVGALAYGDLWFGGKTRNPWNLNEGASGSSAGSAAATAAGLSAFSIGTETFGSITSPSQRCGTTGLRPTYGRVSRAGGMALCWSLDKVGPICRRVEDTGMVLAAINGGDARDPASIDMPFNHDAGNDLKGLRMGWLPAAYEGEDVTEVDRAALEAARCLGFEMIEARLPDLPYDSLVATLYAEAAASFEQLTLSDEDDTLRRQDDGAWPNAFRKARFLSAVDHVQLDRLRRKVMEALDALFRDVDVLIGPFSTGPMLIASNFTGHPCLHLPAGFHRVSTRSELSLAEGRLDLGAATDSEETYEVPHGVSLWSGLFEESLLLSVGTRLEALLGVAARRPTLAR